MLELNAVLNIGEEAALVNGVHLSGLTVEPPLKDILPVGHVLEIYEEALAEAAAAAVELYT